MSNVTLHLGDALDVLRGMEPGSVDAVITSPPYAMQREDFYGGIPEADYPDWLVRWARPLKQVLSDDGNIAINIREHVKDGQISDYVHRARLAMRADGWIECDELIWYKPSSPPVGHPGRPRRSWERVLWFAKHGRSYCNPQANGRESNGVGMRGPKPEWVNGLKPVVNGIARSTDVITVSVGGNQLTGHPAAYPAELAAWLIKLFCPVGGVVCDPFLGSGTTAVAAILEGRNAIGIEIDPTYFAIAEKRIAQAQAQPPLIPHETQPAPVQTTMLVQS